jgi:hypothetical protein
MKSHSVEIVHLILVILALGVIIRLRDKGTIMV